MTDIKGPAIDPETFRVEGHCCGIRIPALADLTGEGLRFEISAELKAELVAAGILTVEGRPEPPKPRITPGQPERVR